MISSPCYPYPVHETSTARRVALQPHIYSPSESHSSPRNAMYPHLHSSGSPSPSYIYAGYDQYYSKDSWASAVPAWSTVYPFPRASLAENTVNPKVTIHPPPPVLVTDIDTPSSTSSLTVLTPPSPFARHDMCDAESHSMDSFDDFDYDDDEDYIDSDFADEMEIDDGDGDGDGDHALVYAPHVKSTSALQGALDDPRTDLGVFSPADRRLSASVPGYPSTSQRGRTSPRLTSPVPASYPSQQHPQYTQRNMSHTHPSPASASLYHHMSMSSSSLAGAVTSPPLTRHATLLPIHQPQPIRPIPPIPLAELAANAHDRSSPDPASESTAQQRAATRSLHAPPSHTLRTLSPLPLLCQPVSDAVRYQLKEPSAYDSSESMCEDAPERLHPFTRLGLTACQDHQPGATSVGDQAYSCVWMRR